LLEQKPAISCKGPALSHNPAQKNKQPAGLFHEVKNRSTNKSHRPLPHRYLPDICLPSPEKIIEMTFKSQAKVPASLDIDDE
jgi:hypothetical protein